MANHYEVRRLASGEADLYRQVRMDALKDSPDAFESTYESALLRSAKSWSEQAESTVTGIERATVLGFYEGSPVGVAALYQYLDRAGIAELIQVWVNPAHRGTELAGAILSHLCVWARASNYVVILAEVNSDNVGAIKFYERQGFAMNESFEAKSVLPGRKVSVLVMPL